MIPSPCRYICQMDPVAKLCQGCYRTIDEITAWSKLDNAARREILSKIDERRLEHGPLESVPDNT